MNTLFQVLCLCGSLSSPPHAQIFKEQWPLYSYRTEPLSGGKILLSVSTTYLGFDTDDYRESRMRDFAESYADRKCAGRFQMASVQPPSWPRPAPLYSKRFVFRCR